MGVNRPCDGLGEGGGGTPTRKGYRLWSDCCRAVAVTSIHYRVAKFVCPRVLDDQKLSEDNQKLRYGCPPDYQLFFGFLFENSCP